MTISKLDRPTLVLVMNEAADDKLFVSYFAERTLTEAFSIVSVKSDREASGAFSQFINSSFKAGGKGVITNKDFYVAVIINITDGVEILEKVAEAARTRFGDASSGFFFDVYALLDEQNLQGDKIKAISESLSKLDNIRKSIAYLTRQDQRMDSVFYIVSNQLQAKSFRYLESQEIDNMIARHIFVSAHERPFMGREVMHQNIFRSKDGVEREGFCTMGYKKIERQNKEVIAFIKTQIISQSGLDVHNRNGEAADKPTLDISQLYTEEDVDIDNLLKDNNVLWRLGTVLSLPTAIEAKSDNTKSREVFLEDYFGEGTFYAYLNMNCNELFQQRIIDGNDRFKKKISALLCGTEIERYSIYGVIQYLRNVCVEAIKKKKEEAQSLYIVAKKDYNDYMAGKVSDVPREYAWPREITQMPGDGRETKVAYSIASKATENYALMCRRECSLKLLEEWNNTVDNYISRCDELCKRLNRIQDEAQRDFERVSNGDRLFSEGFAADCQRRISEYSKANKDKVKEMSKYFYAENEKRTLREYIEEEAGKIMTGYWEADKSFYEECKQRFEAARKIDEFHQEIDAFLTRDRIYCLSVNNMGGVSLYQTTCFIYKNPEDEQDFSSAIDDAHGGHRDNADTGINYFKDDDGTRENDIYVLYIEGCFLVEHISNRKYVKEAQS